MLSLTLLRHAKSSWDTPGLDDFDRPLNDRGEAAAPIMGRVLRDRGIVPDIVLCSTSRRTRDTLARLQIADIAPRTEFDDRLYLASANDLLARIKRIEQTKSGNPSSILLIGHNPGLQDLALKLIGKGDARSLIRLQEKFPTAALAHIVFEATVWRDIAPATGLLEVFTTPKEQG